MEIRFARSPRHGKGDPHQWQTYDRYKTVHYQRLGNHPFIDWSKPQPDFEVRGNQVWLDGRIHCFNDVIVRVRKGLELERRGGLPQVRGFYYRYVAWVDGRHSLLRYHNRHLHDDDFHHRVFNWRTGEEVLYERLERRQFPTLSEVLDEAQAVYFAFE